MDLSQIERWESVLPDFGIDAHFLKKQHGACPICGGKDRFRFDNKGGMGTWYCNFCGSGNAFTLIRNITGLSDREIFQRLERYIGFESSTPPMVKQHLPLQANELTPKEIARNKKYLDKAWKESVALDGADPVSLYLKSRVPGCNIDNLSNHIRYHRGMKFMTFGDDDKLVCQGVFPVMLARIVDAVGKPISLHRTYLTKDGEKAPFDKVKKQMAGVRRLQGAAVRLNTCDSRVLGVCEGIETGLAVLTAYKHRINVWALLNCGNMATADILKDCFDSVIIFADHDKIDVRRGHRPGEHAANTLKAKLLEMGLEVEVKIPPCEETDFADIWMSYHRMGHTCN